MPNFLMQDYKRDVLFAGTAGTQLFREDYHSGQSGGRGALSMPRERKEIIRGEN